jgi:predicted DNA-binding helix-hairpin-helix protein
MAELVKVVKMLRVDYRFNGYIHLKGIPHADPALMYEGAKYADRMSYNLELPSEQSLKLLAPQKSKESLLLPMKSLTLKKTELVENKVKGRFLPAGQSTQLIVGAIDAGIV